MDVAKKCFYALLPLVPARARWLLSVLVDHADLESGLVASRAGSPAGVDAGYLSVLTGASLATVRRHLRVLRAAGFLRDSGLRCGRTLQVPVYGVNMALVGWSPDRFVGALALLGEGCSPDHLFSAPEADSARYAAMVGQWACPAAAPLSPLSCGGVDHLSQVNAFTGDHLSVLGGAPASAACACEPLSGDHLSGVEGVQPDNLSRGNPVRGDYLSAFSEAELSDMGSYPGDQPGRVVPSAHDIHRHRDINNKAYESMSWAGDQLSRDAVEGSPSFLSVEPSAAGDLPDPSRESLLQRLRALGFSDAPAFLARCGPEAVIYALAQRSQRTDLTNAGGYVRRIAENYDKWGAERRSRSGVAPAAELVAPVEVPAGGSSAGGSGRTPKGKLRESEPHYRMTDADPEAVRLWGAVVARVAELHGTDFRSPFVQTAEAFSMAEGRFTVVYPNECHVEAVWGARADVQACIDEVCGSGLVFTPVPLRTGSWPDTLGSQRRR